MQTRYGSNRRPKGRGAPSLEGASLAALRLAACLLLLFCVTVLRLFFPGVTETVRATVLPRLEEDMDYRAAIAALGETLSGEATILEALGEIPIWAFGGVPAESTEARALPKGEILNPLPLSLPEAVSLPLEEVFPLPEVPLFVPPEESESMAAEGSAAVAQFLAQQEAFAAHALPLGAAVSYFPLELTFVVPVTGPVSSPFGFRWDPIFGDVRFHFGTDIAVDTGTPFVAFADGLVIAAWESDSWGKYILLDHGGGIYTRYAHASVLYVEAGEWVEMGQTIGRVGATGYATGPHLHFELRAEGMYRNPEFYVNF